MFDDAADIVGGAGKVAKYDRGGAPVGDEREHHATDENHLHGAPQALGEPAVLVAVPLLHGGGCGCRTGPLPQ